MISSFYAQLFLEFSIIDCIPYNQTGQYLAYSAYAPEQAPSNASLLQEKDLKNLQEYAKRFWQHLMTNDVFRYEVERKINELEMTDNQHFFNLWVEFVVKKSENLNIEFIQISDKKFYDFIKNVVDDFYEIINHLSEVYDLSDSSLADTIDEHLQQLSKMIEIDGNEKLPSLGLNLIENLNTLDKEIESKRFGIYNISTTEASSKNRSLQNYSDSQTNRSLQNYSDSQSNISYENDDQQMESLINFCGIRVGFSLFFLVSACLFVGIIFAVRKANKRRRNIKNSMILASASTSDTL